MFGTLTFALSVESHHPGRETGCVATAIESQLPMADHLVESIAA